MDDILAFNKVAITIGGLEIRWYAIFIVTGMIAGLITAIFAAKRRGISTDYVFEMFLWAIPLAIIGARLYYVLTTLYDANGEWTGWTFAKIVNIRTGGLAIYGGLIGGMLGLLIFSFIRKINFISILDIAAVSVIIGQACGRWGNFINQEAYGGLVPEGFPHFLPFSVYIEHCTAETCVCNGAAGWHYATFFYEFFWNLVGYIGMLFLERFIFSAKNKSLPKAGMTLSAYLIWEGIGRGWIEGLRTDSLYFLRSIFGNAIRISQMLSVVMIIIGVTLVIIMMKMQRKKDANSPASSGSTESVDSTDGTATSESGDGYSGDVGTSSTDEDARKD